MSDTISIAGLSKAAVLAALHNATRAVGMGRLHDLGRDMTEAEAREIITRRTDDMGFDRRDELFFDYVQGRPVKSNITDDEFDPWLFDRDAGQGAAKGAIDRLRPEAVEP